MTVKEIRKKMRSMEENEKLIIEGWGQIQKVGSFYLRGPLPEYDDTDIYTDYDAWSPYEYREKWILDDIKAKLKIA